ncbi:MAG TPA: carbohydrate binding domain-containing protein [Streptosporangiaceae bacterium]|nr:carbohydrate binding domain-containing protein [Streptosporangiaceae bacterium]
MFRLALPPAWRRPRGARSRYLTIPAVLALMVPLVLLAMAPATAASAAQQHGVAAIHAAGGSGVAPYVDMSNSQEGLLDTGITQHGLRAFTAAFVIGVGCNQEWGDTEPLGNDPFIDPEISRAKSEGASMIVSSGGADGEPLAWTCTDQSSIDAGYRQIMSDYSPTGLDFDVEGAAQADTAAATRNFQAMKDDGIGNFSVTLPVLPSGLTNFGTGILQAAQSVGVKIPIVNIMAMDYYQGTGVEMGQAAIQAAQSTLAQMQAINPSYTYANLGITPMIGTNDDGSTFTLSDASTLASWANSHGVGRLAFWSVTRDQACGAAAARIPHYASSTCSGVSQTPLAFTSAFTGSSGGGGNDFSVAVSPASAAVNPGGSATATVSTQVTSGSSQTVSLSASGAPSGATVGFSPSSVTAGNSSTMTVTTSSSTAPGTYPISVKGSAASGSHSVTYTLTVNGSGGNNFSVSVSPSSATVAPGSSATATVSTQVTSGSSQTVSLSASGAPSGATVGFSPSSVTAGGSSTMTVTTSSSTPAGTYQITVKGTAASGTKTATYMLTVGTSGGGGPLVNGGFESGSLSPWACQPGDVVVSSPVHSGSHAAQITPTASQTGECDQSVTLKPNTSYTLTGWVEGSYAFIGVSGGASASTWTSSSGWSQLTVPFTTGSSGNVTVFVHGWYVQGNVYADDFSLN